MISRCVLILALVGFSCAATWMGLVPMKPKEFAHKTGCYVSEINDVIPFGETITPIGVCYRITCTTTIMDYASCGTVGTDGTDCYVTKEDLSKPYPDCCSRVKCIQDNQLHEDQDY